MKNVAIFVDHENLVIAARNRGALIDWYAFKNYLASDQECRYPLEAFCYVAIDPRNEHVRDAEIRQLWEDGWMVKSKVGALAGPGRYKCNVDVEMAMDMIFFAHDVKPDIVVMVTGDQDFAPVALKLRERGIRVEVAAYPESLSKVLLNAASGYINLEEMQSEESEESGDSQEEHYGVASLNQHHQEKSSRESGEYDQEEEGSEDSEHENSSTPRERNFVPESGGYRKKAHPTLGEEEEESDYAEEEEKVSKKRKKSWINPWA